jgi:hypothetical protein
MTLNIKTIRELPIGTELMGYKVVKKSVDLYRKRNRCMNWRTKTHKDTELSVTVC